MFGNLDVGLRGCRVARRMIVDQQDRRCVQLQRTLHHLPWVDRHMVNGAFRLLFICDQCVLGIEEKDSKLLCLPVWQYLISVFQFEMTCRSRT